MKNTNTILTLILIKLIVPCFYALCVFYAKVIKVHSVRYIVRFEIVSLVINCKVKF